MSSENFTRILRAFLGRVPFRPFTIELVTRDRVEINHPEAIGLEENLVSYRSSRGVRSFFECSLVSRVIDMT
jgi:hypothetical protein